MNAPQKVKLVSFLPENNRGGPKAKNESFWAEAARYSVLPLDNSRAERMDVTNRPSLTLGRTEFTYYPGMIRIPEGSAPDLKNRSYRITAEVEIPKSGAEGLLFTQGGRFGGLGLYVLEGKPVFHYNTAGVARYTMAAKDKLEPGKHLIVVDFKYDGGGFGKGGSATMMIDGENLQTLVHEVRPIKGVQLIVYFSKHHHLPCWS